MTPGTPDRRRPRQPLLPRWLASAAVPVLAVAAVVSVLASGCGVDTDDEPRMIPRDNMPEALTEPQTASTEAPPDAQQPGEPVDVYFARAVEGDVQLVEVSRTVPRPATEGGVLDALLSRPPQGHERDNGIVTAIPSTTALAAPPVRQDGGVLLVSLNNGLFDIEGVSLRLAFGQIVCTATAFGQGDVSGVLFVVGGSPVPAVDGVGQEVSGPVRCDNYDNLQGEG